MVNVDGDEADECDADLPPNYVRIRHDGSALKRPYSTYDGPLGKCYSKSAAWTAYRASLPFGNVDAMDPVSPALSTMSNLDGGAEPDSPVSTNFPFDSAPCAIPRQTNTSARSRLVNLPTTARSRELKNLFK